MVVNNMGVVVAPLILNLMGQPLLTFSPTTQMYNNTNTTTTNLNFINNKCNIKLMKVRALCESTCLATIVSTANNSRDIYTCNNKLIFTPPQQTPTIRNQFTQNHQQRHLSMVAAIHWQ